MENVKNGKTKTTIPISITNPKGEKIPLDIILPDATTYPSGTTSFFRRCFSVSENYGCIGTM
jgi:hypothetical protein